MAVVNWIVLLLIGFTSSALLFNRDWRWNLSMLAIQYVGVFWMVQTHWPVSMAAVKIVTGWMGCAILGIAQLNSRKERGSDRLWFQGRLFQVFASIMMFIVTFMLSEQLVNWLGIIFPVAWSGLILLGLGLLQLGITSDSFKVVIGLLTIMAGFEILYTAVENSALVTALLALVNLGLSLIGAYFLITPLETNL